MIDKLPTVWVVQDNGYTLTSAQKYGVLRFITQEDFHEAGDNHEQRIRRDVTEFCAEYVREDDYILLVGNPIMIGFVFAEMQKRRIGVVSHKLLKWDRMYRKYFVYHLDI